MLDPHVVLFSAGVHPEGTQVVVRVAVRTTHRREDGGTFRRTPTGHPAVHTRHATGPVLARRLVAQL